MKLLASQQDRSVCSSQAGSERSAAFSLPGSDSASEQPSTASQSPSQPAAAAASQQPASQSASKQPTREPPKASAASQPASQQSSQLVNSVVLRGDALLYESSSGKQVDGLPPVPTS